MEKILKQIEKTHSKIKNLEEEKKKVVEMYDNLIQLERNIWFELNKEKDYYQLNELSKEENITYVVIECDGNYTKEMHYLAIIGKSDNMKKVIEDIEDSYFHDFYADCESSLDIPEEIEEDHIDAYIANELDGTGAYAEVVSQERLIEIMRVNYGIEEIREIRLD